MKFNAEVHNKSASKNKLTLEHLRPEQEILCFNCFKGTANLGSQIGSNSQTFKNREFSATDKNVLLVWRIKEAGFCSRIFTEILHELLRQ